MTSHSDRPGYSKTRGAMTGAEESHAQRPQLQGNLKYDVQDGEKTAYLLEEMLRRPGVPVQDIALEAGFDDTGARSIAKRLVERFRPLLEKVRAPTQDEIAELLGGKLRMMIGHMTDDKFEKLSGDRLAFAIGVIYDKVRLAQGQPSFIMSFEQRMDKLDIARAIKAELDRRAKIIDVTPDAKEIAHAE